MSTMIHTRAEKSAAPRVDWSAMSDSDHFVQFYQSDPYLLRSLCGFIGTALRSGDIAIVVATPEHRDRLDSLLVSSGFDPAMARSMGGYIELDAADTLRSFMIDGMPDPMRFEERVGAVLGRASARGKRVRAFGEMVALLWAEGNRAGAIRLEELWNELGKRYSFSLFCAYPMRGFDGEELAAPLHHVCSAHTRVIPDESYTGLETPDERLRAITGLQQKARSLEAEISERKRAEAELLAIRKDLEEMLIREKALRAEAESANRLKDEFLATVSHELRTPLNAIVGWAHLLRDGHLDSESVECALETIERNAHLQTQLINDLLDVSRIISGKLHLSIEPVDIGGIIHSAIETVRLAADAKNIRLGLRIDPGTRPIPADPRRLRQVVWNLLSNAIRFTPHGGEVDLHLGSDGSNVRLTVCDTGVGISPDFLPFVFDRFRQADSSITRQQGGLGLGLSIVRHLVELHGGSVEASSPGEGAGATFTVLFPHRM